MERMSDMPRVLGGRYRLDAPLGRGGVGEVWQGQDEVLGRAVAVKMVDLSRAEDPAAAERFRREARIAATLSHPGIITVFDTGVEGPTAYLVTELLSGPTLAQALADRGPIPVDDVVAYVGQACAALGAAHEAGVVHRDVKPGNLMLADDGRVRVLDFGIARIHEAAGQTALTATSTVMGTADYLAPEQARGSAVDPRADLYALGCVTFALLTGRPPFQADSPVGVLGQHLYAEPPRLADLRPDVPPYLDTLVADLLAKDPDARPGSAEEVVRRLEDGGRAAGAPGVSTGRTSVLPAPDAAGSPRRSRRRSDRRGRSAGVLAAAAALAVAALLTAMIVHGAGDPQSSTGASGGRKQASHTPSPTPSHATTPTETSTPTPSPTATSTGPTTPAKALVAAERALRRAAVQGDLKRHDTRDLQRRLSDVARHLARSDTEGAAKKAADLAEKVDKLDESHQVDPAALRGLRRAVRTLQSTLPRRD